MTITVMQSAAVVTLLVILALVVFALGLLLLYLVVRAAVRSGIDRSELATFLRRVKLAEWQQAHPAAPAAEESPAEDPAPAEQEHNE